MLQFKYASFNLFSSHSRVPLWIEEFKSNTAQIFLQIIFFEAGFDISNHFSKKLTPDISQIFFIVANYNPVVITFSSK